MLSRVAKLRDGLRPSEQRVAATVLADPNTVLHQSMAQLARSAGVSEPTVMRFCQAMGARGFQDFKLQLAQSLAGQLRYAQQAIRSDDSPGRLASKVIDGAIASLSDLRNGLDEQALSQAVELLARSRRVECYGLGGAGIVASDAQFKLSRLGIPTVAYSDPHCHRVAASLLGPGDAVLAVSNSGANRLLLASVDLALEAGADVVAVTAGGSPLAERATVCLSVTAHINGDRYAPIQARIAPMVVIDTLVIGIALAQGPVMQNRLGRLEAVLEEDFLSDLGAADYSAQ